MLKWQTTAITALAAQYGRRILTAPFVWQKPCRRAECGLTPTTLFRQAQPFGGYKESGIGRETHKVMLEHYSQTKNIMINLGEKPLGLY